VLPEPNIDRQVAGQSAFALLGVREGHGVGPLLAEGLDETLGHPVGSGGVGPGANVPQPQGAAGFGKRFGDVGRAVVAHHPPAFDPLVVEPGDSTAEKADHRWLLLIRQYLDVGQAYGVIHGNMDLVVAEAVGAALLAIAGGAVAHIPEPRQRLDVEMDQVAECSHSYRCTGGLGSRFLSRPSPRRLRALATLEKGALSSRAMWRRWSRWWRRSTACWSCRVSASHPFVTEQPGETGQLVPPESPTGASLAALSQPWFARGNRLFGMPETASPPVDFSADAELISFLKAIPDGRYRRGGGVRYPQWYLLLVAVIGIVSDCNSSRDLEAFARRHREALDQELGLNFKRWPTDATFLYLFNKPHLEQFGEALLTWMISQFKGGATTWDQLVCDGKTLKGSAIETADGNHRFVVQVTVYGRALGVALAQKAYDTNESNARSALKALLSAR